MNNRGFVLASLPFTLGLTVSAFIFLGFIFNTVVNIRKAMFLCHQQSLRAQKANESNLNQLMKLNPRATSLRAQRKIAENLLKIAIRSKVPKAIAAAQARLMYVVAQQRKLQFQQKSILFSAIQNTATISRRGIRNLKKLIFVSQVKVWGATDLKVKALPRASLTPNYELKSSFSKKQSLGYEFIFQTPRHLYPFKVTKNCGATIEGQFPQFYLRPAERPWR